MFIVFDLTTMYSYNAPAYVLQTLLLKVTSDKLREQAEKTLFDEQCF